MYNLIESNSTILDSLAFKYECLRLFKSKGITTTTFSISQIIGYEQDDLLELIGINHSILETYLEFKDTLIGEFIESNTLPLTPKIPHNSYDLFDNYDNYDLLKKLCSSLGFKYKQTHLEVSFDYDEFKDRVKELLIDFNLIPDFFDHGIDTVFNQTIVTHPLIDDIYSSNNVEKIEKISSFVGANSIYLAHLFLQIVAPCYSSTKSFIVPVKDIKFLKSEFELNSKYALVMNSASFEGYGDNWDFPLCVKYFLELYKLLKE